VLREWLEERGTKPVIPNRSNRKQHFKFDKGEYCEPRHIENAFCKLKDFRRIFTRYDKPARNFLASVCLAATIVWWEGWTAPDGICCARMRLFKVSFRP